MQLCILYDMFLFTCNYIFELQLLFKKVKLMEIVSFTFLNNNCNSKKQIWNGHGYIFRIFQKDLKWALAKKMGYPKKFGMGISH